MEASFRGDNPASPSSPPSPSSFFPLLMRKGGGNGGGRRRRRMGKRSQSKNHQPLLSPFSSFFRRRFLTVVQAGARMRFLCVCVCTCEYIYHTWPQARFLLLRVKAVGSQVQCIHCFVISCDDSFFTVEFPRFILSSCAPMCDRE